MLVAGAYARAMGKLRPAGSIGGWWNEPLPVKRTRQAHYGNLGMSVKTTPPGDGHVIFLLGAGASKDAGFPLVQELTSQLRDRLPYVKCEGKTRSEFPDLFDTSRTSIPIQRTATNASSSGSGYFATGGILHFVI